MIKMSSLKFFLIFVFLISLSSSLFTFTIAANPTFLALISSEENFTRNSTYQSNLNFLLASLLSNANSSDGFSNTTAGQDPSRVYGLFQCRGDVNTSTCQDCVAFASNEATQRCPNQKGAELWYDECLLHYSASDFFSTVVLTPYVKFKNTKNVTIQPDGFYTRMLSLMYESASQAPYHPKKFATGKGEFTTFQTLYTLVQCTQDLSSTGCSRCLQEAISLLPNVSIGGRMLLPSCHCRFDVYPFYTENETLPTAPTPSPPPPVTRPEGKSRISSSIIVAIVVPVTVSVLLFVAAGYCLLPRRARKKYNPVSEEIGGNDILTIEALQFDFGTIQAATNRFSTDNKLGAGGFGEVYKVVLPNGQEIAVKRLSKKSSQGAKEFQNEVIVVAKLQHRNLVRLQGFCLEGEEKILVYEFVPNKSLDYFLYEYAMHGQFSVKSDVYSFGVLVLEIITGRKNSSFYQTDRVWNLLSYAWEQWRDETPMQLLDSTLIDSYSQNEVMRCIHVGLLCVQEDPAVRPTMATVVHILNSHSVSLPLPQQPAFFLGTRTEVNMHTPIRVDTDQSTSKSMPWSVDNASITELNPR